MKRMALLAVLLTFPLIAQEPARIDLIGAEIFSVDRAHSYFGFSIGFLGMTKVRGTFNDYAATILYDDKHPERSSVTVSIDAASIDTGNEGRDRDLKAEPFFDVANHPRIRFRSTSIEHKRGDEYIVHGELTMKGVTRAVDIPMTRTVPRTADKGWGNIRIGGAGKTTVRRKDFGVNGTAFWSEAISDDVLIEIDLLGNRFNYDRFGFDSREKPSIGEVVFKTADANGGAAAAAQFRELRRDKPNDYNFGPGQIGVAISRLMQHRRIADALELLNAAVEAYPNESGFYARSGEAYATLGKREEAIRMYEKVLTISPEGTEALEMLRRLRR